MNMTQEWPDVWSCLAWSGQLSNFLGQEFEAILLSQGQTYQNLSLFEHILTHMGMSDNEIAI